MSFINPQYLWFLASLLLPLLIHLWSKDRLRIKKLGTIRFLPNLQSVQSRRRALDEIPLMLLRMLCLAFFIFMIAGPQWNTATTEKAPLYLVEKDIFTDQRLEALLDTLPEDRLRILDRDFPFTPTNGENKRLNIWGLVPLMENLEEDSIVIFTYGRQRNFQGKRPTTSKKLNWIILDAQEEIADFEFQQSEDFWSFSTRSTDKNVLIGRQIITGEVRDSEVLEKPQTYDLLIVADSERSTEILEKSLKTIEIYLGLNLRITHSETLPEVIDTYYAIFDFSRKHEARPDGPKYWNAEQSNAIFGFSYPSTVEQARDSHFTGALLEWLQFYPELDYFIASNDPRSLDVSQIAPLLKVSETSKRKGAAKASASWWLLLLILLGLERILALKRKK